MVTELHSVKSALKWTVIYMANFRVPMHTVVLFYDPTNISIPSQLFTLAEVVKYWAKNIKVIGSNLVGKNFFLLIIFLVFLGLEPWTFRLLT